jgi:disulfide oxidoreductase YuzD
MGKEVGTFVSIPGVYLEASYVACGMMVGIQNYRYLQSKEYKIKPKYPCVRFDIEDAENSKKVTTKLNRETTTEMVKSTKDAIMEDRFGFVFADDKIIYNGNVINNTYVLNARTLKKGNNGKYKPLYKTLVRNFVDQLLRSSAVNVTDDIVKQFQTEYVEKWKRDNKDEDRKYANRILLQDETIDLDQAKHRLVVTFNKEPEVWDDIVINDSEGEV